MKPVKGHSSIVLADVGVGWTRRLKESGQSKFRRLRRGGCKVA